MDMWRGRFLTLGEKRSEKGTEIFLNLVPIHQCQHVRVSTFPSPRHPGPVKSRGTRTRLHASIVFLGCLYVSNRKKGFVLLRLTSARFRAGRGRFRLYRAHTRRGLGPSG